ncbi:MAG: hypothetical protein AB7E79_10575 [Rhodospirillaceae bacterium]
MSGINRRSALGIGAAGIAAFNVGTLRAESTEPKLKAVVAINGRTYEFREEGGTDLGDYVAPGNKFVQRCIRSEVADFPMSVFFRPDRGSDRVEVVFELGRVFSQSPVNLGAYNVVISRGEHILARVDVPQHYWFARWRWQSAPRPIVADAQELMRYGLLPPYARKTEGPAADTLNLMPLPSGDYVDLGIVREFTGGNYDNAAKLLMKAQEFHDKTTGAGAVWAKLSTAQTTYSVMGLAGVRAYMPSTGERPDIGLVTEPQAQFIATADQGALELLMSQAEAAGTMPWHIRDERQNGPFDFRAYPDATWYFSANAGAPHIKATETPITIDSAHQPALAYLPFLLTDDPYFLEELQFQATWNWGSLPAKMRPTGVQTRMIAWNLRTLAQVTRVTQAVTPAWLLPHSYWIGELTKHRQWFETNYVNNPSPERQVFRACGDINNSRDEPLAPGGTWVDPWQDEFLAAVLGWVIYMGFSDWRPAFNWAIGGTIARSSQTRGWVRAFATPYRMILRETKTAPIASNWAQAWELTRRLTQKTVADPNTWAESDMTYLTYTRGALVYADLLGVPEAKEALAWATQELKKKNWNVAAKWRMGMAV